jgi:hypothetical protein
MNYKNRNTLRVLQLWDSACFVYIVGIRPFGKSYQCGSALFASPASQDSAFAGFYESGTAIFAGLSFYGILDSTTI